MEGMSRSQGEDVRIKLHSLSESKVLLRALPDPKKVRRLECRIRHVLQNLQGHTKNKLRAFAQREIDPFQYLSKFNIQ